MLTSAVWILAGVTAWCVASLALALIVGPMIATADRQERRARRLLKRGSSVSRMPGRAAVVEAAVAVAPERRAA